MVNKLDGVFTEDDEKAFEMFSVYCGLALHNAKVEAFIRLPIIYIVFQSIYHFNEYFPCLYEYFYQVIDYKLRLQLYEEIQSSEQKYKVAVDVLSYHRAPNEDECQRFLSAKPLTEEQTTKMLRCLLK